jgi:hypothetical protein
MASSINALTAAGGGIAMGADASGILQLQSAGTATVTVDASGNVGIGTASPSAIGKVLNLYGGAGIGSSIALQADNGAQFVTIYQGVTASDPTSIFSNNGFKFATATAKDATGFVERMRIDSSGSLLVGTTTNADGVRGNFEANSNNNIIRAANSAATGNVYCGYFQYSGQAPNNTVSQFITCNDTGATRAVIRANGGLANFSANNVNLSDRREKTNFTPATSYLDKICAIPVQTFNYIDQNMEEDGGLTLGVVAQDVQDVAPEMVMESNWGTEEEPKMRLSIYQTDLQYALMKCIQEQQALITQLQADVATLKALSA